MKRTALLFALALLLPGCATRQGTRVDHPGYDVAAGGYVHYYYGYGYPYRHVYPGHGLARRRPVVHLAPRAPRDAGRHALDGGHAPKPRARAPRNGKDAVKNRRARAAAFHRQGGTNAATGFSSRQGQGSAARPSGASGGRRLGGQGKMGRR